MTRFVIPGNPVPKERARVLREGRSYTPLATRVAEERIRAVARSAGVELVEGPVALHVRFYRSDRKRVDNDNLLKLVQDALIGIAYRDDSQITDGSQKRLIDPERPRTEIELRSLAKEERCDAPASGASPLEALAAQLERFGVEAQRRRKRCERDSTEDGEQYGRWQAFAAAASLVRDLIRGAAEL